MKRSLESALENTSLWKIGSVTVAFCLAVSVLSHYFVVPRARDDFLWLHYFVLISLFIGSVAYLLPGPKRWVRMPLSLPIGILSLAGAVAGVALRTSVPTLVFLTCILIIKKYSPDSFK